MLKKALIRTGVFISSIGIMSNEAMAELNPTPWNSAVKYEIIETGKGDQPKVGDLVAIRFKGSYKGTVFDDTFKKEQPYFYRAGVGLLLPGVDDAVVQMHVGDKWKLSFGGEQGFKVQYILSTPNLTI
jgi:FKBP-type peptidyl-prolyl cis-trans isomerase